MAADERTRRRYISRCARVISRDLETVAVEDGARKNRAAWSFEVSRLA